MKQRDLQLMQEMGLTYWQVRKPDFYPGRELPAIDLPESCKLLFVCDDELDEHDRWLFGRILSSMKLINPAKPRRILNWIWKARRLEVLFLLQQKQQCQSMYNQNILTLM